MIKKIIESCNEEIRWTQANIDEMNLHGNPHNYDDCVEIYVLCWLKAHKKILDIINKGE